MIEKFDHVPANCLKIAFQDPETGKDRNDHKPAIGVYDKKRGWSLAGGNRRGSVPRFWMD
jgi:hypothetical protein